MCTNQLRVQNGSCNHQSCDALLGWNSQNYPVKIIYCSIDWVCMGIPQQCIVGLLYVSYMSSRVCDILYYSCIIYYDTHIYLSWKKTPSRALVSMVLRFLLCITSLKRKGNINSIGHQYSHVFYMTYTCTISHNKFQKDIKLDNTGC